LPHRFDSLQPNRGLGLYHYDGNASRYRNQLAIDHMTASSSDADATPGSNEVNERLV